MFGPNVVGTGLTLGKVLSGISKGLTIANQVIPLYQQAKPMIQNARKVMEVVREFKATPSTSTPQKATIEAKAVTKSSQPQIQMQQKTPQLTESSQSMPVFFQ